MRESTKEDDLGGAAQASQSRQQKQTATLTATSASTVTPMPKHMPFPEYPASSEILNELIMFLFSTCVAAMQFINIYRTNWWLPQAQVTNTVNLQHIDSRLIALILVMNLRRLIFCLSAKALNVLLPPSLRSMQKFFKWMLEALVLVLPITCIAMMYHNRNYLTLFLLLYPFVVYFFAFGLAIEPFLRFNYELKGAYFNGFPMHCCSTNPNGIRLEIDVLRNDFNGRFKQVIFTALLNTYYCTFLPCYFAHSVYYNMLWAGLHIVMVFLSVFTMCTVFNFPSKYVDILHRAALHLGLWTKQEIKPEGEDKEPIQTPNVWQKTSLCAPNMLVKHAGETYASRGPVTVAIPGNATHARFYKLFHNPSKIYGSLTSFQTFIIVLGLYLLYYAVEWHFILSLSFITLTNQFTYFKLMRDYLITRRVYLTETNVSEAKLTD